MGEKNFKKEYVESLFVSLIILFFLLETSSH